MTGCRVGAKNTLDRTYLWLAEKRGLTIAAETEVTTVTPREGGGYFVHTKPTFGSAPGLTYTADHCTLLACRLGRRGSHYADSRLRGTHRT